MCVRSALGQTQREVDIGAARQSHFDPVGGASTQSDPLVFAQLRSQFAYHLPGEPQVEDTGSVKVRDLLAVAPEPIGRAKHRCALHDAVDAAEASGETGSERFAHAASFPRRSKRPAQGTMAGAPKNPRCNTLVSVSSVTSSSKPSWREARK